MDFFNVVVSEVKSGPRKGEFDIFPDFIVGRSEDLMVKGKSFYAIWDEEKQIWSTDEYDVQRLVDDEIRRKIKDIDPSMAYSVKWMRSNSSGSWRNFRNFIALLSDNAHDLDNNVTFLNSEVKKDDYVTRRLPYALAGGECPAYDELIGTLYSVEERAKFEWLVGSVIAGDSKTIQKFVVLYGAPGTGKGTVLAIIQKLFKGYYTTFDAKALGSGQSQFSTESFKNNPLVAIQQDGDLSRISDNSTLNSIISHEDMPMNEKYKSVYTGKVNAVLFMGTNKPVKITDAKSGIIRRLIDVHPTGVQIPESHYQVLMSKMDFELGAIAAHCLKVYREMGKHYYSGYRPLEMMLQTDVFFNFVEYNWEVFKEQDGTTLHQAYLLYKDYCVNSELKPMPMYRMREELKNYFKEYKDRGEFNGSNARSIYRGFSARPFKSHVKGEHAFSLNLDQEVSLLDEVLADQVAQYANAEGLPGKRWANVREHLKNLDTSKLHYVKVPEQHIVIDFDLTDEAGNKSLDRNLEAASAWPATYGELSQGGNGVHLHYLYDGDVHQLSSVYSRGIEIKTLLGDASLRRRVTRCNSTPIAKLATGLPLKEKRVIEDKTLKDELHIRSHIRNALQKKHHPGTKPEVDFIKKILDEAYESGMSYDVTDLKPQIIAFANSSSNQSLLSLSIVQKMRFKSELVEEQLATVPDEPPLAVYDVEVYPNLFVVCWKYRGAPDDTVVAMVNPTPEQIAELVKLRLIGFYVRRYDNHILYARMLGYTNAQLYELSQKIIEHKNPNAMFGEAYNLSYADIWEYSSVKKSLKRFQIDLGLQHMESNIPWDQDVPDELIPKVVEYCINDVNTTDKVADDREGDFVARQILAELSGLSVNSTTQQHTAQIIFGNDRNPQSQFVYTHLDTIFPGYTYDKGKSDYRGINPSEGGFVYEEEGYYTDTVVLDVESMHPTSIIQLNLFGKYTKNFKDLLDARLAIKHKDYVSARKMLNGRLKPFLEDEKQAKQLSYALKIVINIVYGLTSAKFDSRFKDPRNNDNIVAKRGALFMIDLMSFVQERGFTVAHIKTDSIKIPNATPEIIEDVVKFGEKYGYTFEHEETFDKFCLVNKAVYVGRIGWHAEDPDKVGMWEAVGAQYQHPYVYKTLFSHEKIEFEDLREAKQVIQGSMYLDLAYDAPPPVAERMQYIGKTGLFVPVLEGTPGAGILYRVKDGKCYSVTGTKGFLWVEADTAETLGETQIDMRYFEKLLDAAVDNIEKYVPMEELTDG